MVIRSADTLNQECETIRDSLKVSIKFSILIDRQVDRSNEKNAKNFSILPKKELKNLKIGLESSGRPKITAQMTRGSTQTSRGLGFLENF